jgi:hypothetical protein
MSPENRFESNRLRRNYHRKLVETLTRHTEASPRGSAACTTAPAAATVDERSSSCGCPGRQSPSWAGKRPARPYKTNVIQNRITVGNAERA